MHEATPAEPDEPTRYRAVIERFAPSPASVLSGWVVAVVLLVGGAALNAFLLREAALMPGNIPMVDGTVADRLVRGVLPTLYGWVAIVVGIGLVRRVRVLHQRWIEIREGGIRQASNGEVREVPWRMVVGISVFTSYIPITGLTSRDCSVTILVKRGESLANNRDSVHRLKRFIRLLHERTTALGIPWHEKTLDLR
jgi:hypothetical protein